MTMKPIPAGMTTLATKIRGWIRLSRPAFYTVGLAPFALGTVAAWRTSDSFDGRVCILGALVVILIMLATYQAGEYYDVVEDGMRRHSNPFAGGSGVVKEGILSRKTALTTSVISLAAALALSLILQFGLERGSLTTTLTVAGAFFGFFYSAVPLRLVARGMGETAIGLCYGWLPVASAYYIQTGTVRPIVHILSLPIGLSIINVILVNEYPDYDDDRRSGKKNLLVRLGKSKGAILIAAVTGLLWLSAPLILWCGLASRILFLLLPALGLSSFVALSMIRGRYNEAGELKRLSLLTIAVNLGVTGSLFLSFP
ncbi:MAG: prenyltransferase [Deltaproteobacteria bacterium]|nr:prenyltransferase [Deltaproteobacteria bacterium]